MTTTELLLIAGGAQIVFMVGAFLFFSSQMRRELLDHASRARLDVESAHRSLREEVSASIRNVGDGQLRQLDVMAKQWVGIHESSDLRAASLHQLVADRLDQIQKNNSDRLEAMRATVEEKLQGTLDRRLGESFKLVSERLEQVQRGLGEMQSLATGVGDLKRVLTNVKTRGTWGEAQLAMILEQIFTPDQYEANSRLGRKSPEMVEFAIKIPSKDEQGGVVYLPIDSKFPQEQYQRILAAQDLGDPEALAAGRRELELALLKSAREIRDKYVHPPHTTDFGVMFLPTEGLYAEALRTPGILERLQNECRVSVAGPMTVAALLSSIQMGLRSMAIQKRSGEVWKVLGAVKTEFGKFGDMLDNVQKTLQTAANKIEDASKKTRHIETKLRGVEALPIREGASVGLIEEELTGSV